MKTTGLVFMALLCLGPADAPAQPALDCWYCAPFYGPDNYQIYFDSTVECDYGGILANPAWWALQSVPSIHAYLVLIDPSESEISGWELQWDLQGMLAIADATEYPVPVFAGTTTDPAEVEHTLYILVDWTILNLDNNIVDFHVRPAPASGHDMPGYYSAGEFIPMHNPINAYWDFQRPIMQLNGAVTPTRQSTWGDVRRTFR